MATAFVELPQIIWYNGKRYWRKRVWKFLLQNETVKQVCCREKWLSDCFDHDSKLRGVPGWGKAIALLFFPVAMVHHYSFHLNRQHFSTELTWRCFIRRTIFFGNSNGGSLVDRGAKLRGVICSFKLFTEAESDNRKHYYLPVCNNGWHTVSFSNYTLAKRLIRVYK